MKRFILIFLAAALLVGCDECDPNQTYPPKAPTNLSGTESEGDVLLSWTDNASNENYYEVYRNDVLLAELDPDSMNYTDEGAVIAGATFTYKVAAINGDGKGYSNLYEITFEEEPEEPTIIPPATPSDFALYCNNEVAGSEYVWGSWTDTVDDYGYRVEKSSNGNDFTQLVFLAKDATSFTDESVNADETWFYRIIAVNYEGDGESEPTEVLEIYVEAGVIPTSEAPTNLTAVESGNNVLLSWTDNSDNEDYFEVYKNGSWEAELNANSTSYTDYGSVVAGETFTYQLRAVNSGGYSDFATTEITFEIPFPEAPENFTLYLNNDTYGSEYVYGTWEEAFDQTGYRIERSSNGFNFSLLAILPQEAIGFVDTSVNAGETWFYRVYAFNESGDSLPVTSLGIYVEPGTIEENPEATAYLEMTAVDGRTIREILESENFELNFGSEAPNVEGTYDTERYWVENPWTAYFESILSNQSELYGDITWIQSGIISNFEDALMTGTENNFTWWYIFNNGTDEYLLIETGIIDEETGIINTNLIQVVISGPSFFIYHYISIYTPQ